MSKADVLALVQELARGRADPLSCERYYEDLSYELAKQGQVCDVELVEATKDQASFPFPETAVDIMGMIYEGTQLNKTGRQALEWHDRSWRDRTGKPRAYVLEDETVRTYRLYPKPDRATSFLGFDQRFGINYPPGIVAILFSQKREDLPEYFDLYLTMEILAREFKRESDHRDMKYAEACEQLARLFYQMVTNG